MSKTLNRVISICLVVALMCGIFITPIAQPKADASIAIATTGMIAAGVTLLTMLGITFASTGAAEKASKAIVEGSKDIHDWVKRIIPGPSGDPDKNTLMMDAAATGGLALFVNKAKELFGNKKKSGTVAVPDDEFYVYQNVKYVKDFNPTGMDYGGQDFFQYLFCNATYSCFGENNAIVLVLNDIVYKYWFEVKDLYDDYKETILYCRIGDIVRPLSTSNGDPFSFRETSHWCRGFDHWVGRKFGFYRCKDSKGNFYLLPFIGGCYINNEGEVKYCGYRKIITSNYEYGRFPLSGGNVTPATAQIPYQNVSPYEMSIIYNALAEKLEKGNITIDYSDTLDQIENHSDEQLNISQEQLLEQTEIRETLEEIKAGQGDGTTQLEEQDMNIPEAPDLTWKFPFCIPFDLIALVGALNAKPKDPKWEIPFHVESIGFDDSMELDLTKFEPVSEVLRVIITIMFLLGLIVVTRKMIKG